MTQPSFNLNSQTQALKFPNLMEAYTNTKCDPSYKAPLSFLPLGLVQGMNQDSSCASSCLEQGTSCLIQGTLHASLWSPHVVIQTPNHHTSSYTLLPPQCASYKIGYEMIKTISYNKRVDPCTNNQKIIFYIRMNFLVFVLIKLLSFVFLVFKFKIFFSVECLFIGLRTRFYLTIQLWKMEKCYFFIYNI